MMMMMMIIIIIIIIIISGKEVKIQEFMYRDTTNVEPEMYDYTRWEGGGSSLQHN